MFAASIVTRYDSLFLQIQRQRQGQDTDRGIREGGGGGGYRRVWKKDMGKWNKQGYGAKSWGNSIGQGAEQ